MTDLPPPNLPLVEVGRYERLSQARERALVVSAMELPHWIERDGNSFVLRVEAPVREAVSSELEQFEAEQAQRAAVHTPEKELPKTETLSLYVAAWMLGGFWLLQNIMPPWWEERGRAFSVAIANGGEWWRAATALTLHGDVSHLVANIAFGLLFSGFALPHLGTGATWLAIIGSGCLGNLLNAFFYRSTPHISIGASTAVFGALGILVATDFVARFSSPATRSRWQLVVPLGGGLALLAFLGAEDEQHKHTDYMAHLWGFSSGLVLGTLAAVLHVRDRASRGVQRAAALAAPGLIFAAWWLAYASLR